MKKELKNTAVNTAPTVETANGTENQTTNTTAEPVETTENGALTPTAEAAAPKALTFEELQKRLDAELSKLNYKKRLARHRETFINSMGSLQLYIDQLTNENEFETKSGKISFKILENDQYDRPNFVETFTISNTYLINKFCNMLLSEMKEKKAELENQLLTA